MDRMIYTALNSLSNSRFDQRVNAQNLANLNVPGFKKDLSTVRASTFLANMDQYQSRYFAQASQETLFSSQNGAIQRTDERMDFAIRDQGYFFIEPKNGADIALSRRGDFAITADRFLTDGAGNFMLDNDMNKINVPQNRDLIIDESGVVLIEPIDAPDGTRQQIAILGTTLAEDAQLVKSIDGYIRPYNKNEMPVADQRAEVAQGFLEGSNATALDALLANIEGQRYFELNVKFIKEAKNIDEATTRIMRLPGT